jgi:RNA polymerase sporulation-specific sigma factor
MTKYEMLQDDDLIKLSRLGDKDAEEFLLVKYTPMVISETRTLFLIGAELEDLTQEGMIGLFMAIRDYSLESDASFKTFAYSCIRNRLKAAITRANRMKHSPLNTYISVIFNNDYEDSLDNDGQEKLSDRGANNPESLFIKNERISQMYEELEMKLSAMEKKVVELYLRGLSRSEIADELGKTEKSVDNALTRIHTKLRDEK